MASKDKGGVAEGDDLARLEREHNELQERLRANRQELKKYPRNRRGTLHYKPETWARIQLYHWKTQVHKNVIAEKAFSLFFESVGFKPSKQEVEEWLRQHPQGSGQR